jgi:hypothetical protein
LIWIFSKGKSAKLNIKEGNWIMRHVEDIQQELRDTQRAVFGRIKISVDMKIWAIVQLEKEINKIEMARIRAYKNMYKVTDYLDELAHDSN